jgi:GNAT superfamily N-acetyltransferase
MATKILPLNTGAWRDFETLFGERGACGGCWCLYWRLSRTEFEKRKGDGNRRTMKGLVKKGIPLGLLAYDGKIPVGWCSVSPREEFPTLNRSRVLSKLDDQPVWSIVCFFIHKDYRKRGVSIQLLKAVTDYVKKQGGKIVEGYPIDPPAAKYPTTFAWTGFVSAFRKAGFQEAARRSPTRPIMRFYL